MHTYQSSQVERKVETPQAEMKLLKNGRVFWNLTKTSINSNQCSNSLVKVLPASYSTNKSEGNSTPKQNLLKYGVGPLKETLDRFLCSVQPLLTPKEFAEQQEITERFKDKEGDNLQMLLEEVGRKEENWLAHRWLSTAYLKYRDPVTVYVSPGMTFPMQEFKDQSAFVNYTAKVIFGLAEFKSIIDDGKIPVVKMGKNELDNSQFGKVFGTCRIPRQVEDEIIYNPCSRHIAVIYKNHFYKLNLYNEEDELLSAPTLAKQLESIMLAESDFGIPYGIFTTDSRDNWAEAYEQLIKMPQNKESIKTIQTSLFTVSLDECVSFKPSERSDQLVLSLIHGGGSTVNSGNRWMDKTIQLVVNPNGNVGFTYEHSPAEGQPIAMMMDYVVKKMSADAGYGACGSTKSCSKPEKLKFCELNECVEQLLFSSKRNIDLLVKDLQMKVLKYDCYGKDYIKKKRLGPDSYVQMALQLAFYKMYKTPAAQYESAHLRIFKNGRTETIRSCSSESLAFCKAMTDKNASAEKRGRLLREAVAGHQKYTRMALQGCGVDRHLLGLKLMAMENNLPIPDFFSSIGYTKSMHYRMSTSQVATVYDAFMGYGPSTADGYGCCYNPRDSDIILAISAWNSNSETCTEKFAASLSQAFREMQNVLDMEPVKSKL